MMCLPEILNAIRSSEKILIIAHIQPDGDTLGSVFALAEMLRKMGKQPDIYCEDGTPGRYAELFPEQCLTELAKKEYELAIAVDCADKSRIGKAHKAFQKAKTSINIDHHITNEKYADINYIDDASSTGEIIFELMRAGGIEQDESTAKYLYIAMSTDTGNFTYSNTGRKCLSYVSELVELFDIRETADILFRRRSLVLTKLIGRAISRLELFQEGKIASMTLLLSDMKEFSASGSDCENIVDFAREIEGTQVAAFFREVKSGVKVSLRSKGNIDVGTVAASFGGGGHMNASGCCPPGKLEEVKAAVIEKLKELV